jgi:hypothetical protein
MTNLRGMKEWRNHADPLAGFPGEYVIYVHYVDPDTEARACEIVREDLPGVEITFAERIKEGKWRVCVK